MIGMSSLAQAGNTVMTTEPEENTESALESWWNGKYGTGNWFGVRDSLEDKGIKFGGSWKGYFYGMTGGGRRTGGAFDEEIKFTGEIDFGKLVGIDGLKLNSSVRWRDGVSPNQYVGAGSNFNPSNIQSGKQWRLGPFYLTYVTPELFGIEDFLTLSGGWQNPYDHFAQQKDSKLFVNNAFSSSKGLGSSGIPWSSSYAAWGGYMKVQPVKWHYAQAGLYLAVPGATSTANHGLYFAGANPPDSNGLYFVGETGVTPKIGSSKLEGKYAMGFTYFGVQNTSFFGADYDARWALYWQADQMLFREPSAPAELPAPMGKDKDATVASSDGKNFKDPVPPAKEKLSSQGLYLINFLTYQPKYNAVLPFYFHTGLVYKGLIPHRDNDQFGVAFGYGQYSYYQILSDRSEGDYVSPTYEAVLEMDYRIQLNKWAYFQPFWQYIIRPSGTGQLGNANIFGFAAGVTF